MLKQTIDILTHYEVPQKRSVLGNVAVARGAIEAGVCGVFSYPGTPSTEISEVFNYVNEFQHKTENRAQYPQQTAHPIYFEYSINEKIALEKAIAFSIGNKSALCVMKNVGMNVACDALMSITYQTIIAPLVVVVCDDPGCHSSSNEQDSRYWGSMASVPLLNPSTPAQALAYTKAAFALSASLRLPVILRLSTRVSHTRNMLQYGSIETAEQIGFFTRMPEHINIPARTAAAHQKLLHKLHGATNTENTKQYIQCSIPAGAKWGIISSGVAAVYAHEILARSKQKENYAGLELGMIHPFPEESVLTFLQQDMKKIIILEELEPIVENNVRLLLQKNNIRKNIYGKGFSTLAVTGEYGLDSVEKALYDFTKDASLKSTKKPLKKAAEMIRETAPRPPALCAGCPHRATFYALKLATPRTSSDVVLCGDIGCNGLGALPPLKMVDTINHMGMSIAMAQGLSEALKDANGKGKTVAMLGDGTFFHSGLTSLVNAIYTKANALIIIFDNRTIGMTGHQDHPGATHLQKYKQIEILPLVKGLGVAYAESIFPFNLRDTYKKINEAMQTDGVAVLISKAPCIFLPEFKEGNIVQKKVVVDHTRCNTCGNHADMNLLCSRCYSPASNLSRAKRKIASEIHVPALEQLCPANICNHGFFNAIIEGNHKDAVAIVRDKMLFARTCGDICHRPCELLSQDKQIVPIKKLKRFVSAVDENFFSIGDALEKMKDTKPKNKHVAIVGAGPAGLSAAYDLIREGYAVDLYDKEEMPGGMLKYIIPYFRMDKSGLDFEAGIPMQLGVRFFGKKLLGRDFSLDELSKHYDAVLLATGLWKPKKINLIEETIPDSKKHTALSFLKHINKQEKSFPQRKNYIVIGGGNSAIDAARAAKKQHAESRVQLICVEARKDMPAFEEEIVHAENEGVEIFSAYRVQTCTLQGANIACTISTLNGESESLLEADEIITAIGHEPNKDLYAEILGCVDKSEVYISPDETTAYTGYKNIFAAGDIVKGNHQSVIGAIASGRKAATGIRHLLEKYSYPYEGQKALDKLNASSGKYRLPVFDTGENTLLADIAEMDMYQPCAKCNHCIDNFGCPAMLKVNGKIEIDYQKCTHCGLCIDVCPNNAIYYEEEILKSHAANN